MPHPWETSGAQGVGAGSQHHKSSWKELWSSISLLVSCQKAEALLSALGIRGEESSGLVERAQPVSLGLGGLL